MNNMKRGSGQDDEGSYYSYSYSVDSRRNSPTPARMGAAAVGAAGSGKSPPKKKSKMGGGVLESFEIIDEVRCFVELYECPWELNRA